MNLISTKANPSGAYPPIQMTGALRVPSGMAIWPESLSTDSFYAYNGFVTLTVEEVGGVPTVTACAPNVEAWEAWKASLPEPEPEAPSETEQLLAAAVAFCSTATLLTDAQALAMPSMFPTWEDVLAAGAALPEGRILSDGGRLYRVVQTVTPQAHQAPHDAGMLAVYRPIDRAHAGTLADPIPWVYGMDCASGLYYGYEGGVYLCKGDMKPCVWAPDTAGLWQWEKV